MNYTSLIYYNPKNPKINKDSEIYKSFVENFNIWGNLDFLNKENNSNNQKRRNSRRVAAVQNPLQKNIEDLVSLLKNGNGNDDIVQEVKKDKKEQSQIHNHNHINNNNNNNKQVIPKKKETHSPIKQKRKINNKKIKEEEKVNEVNEINESSREEDLSESESDIAEAELEPINIKRIKGIVTHPSHVTNPKFGNLSIFLNSFKSLDDDLNNDEYQDYLNNQIKLVGKIKKGIESKTLKLDFNENVDKVHWNQKEEPTMIKLNTKISKFKDPFRQNSVPTHYDHLLAQGIHSSKLIHDSRMSKLQKTRKISAMVEQYFKRKSTSKEKEEKEFKLKILRIAKECAKMVKRRWQQAEKAWRILEERKREQQRILKSRQHLSEMLEHSTQLLEQQMTNNAASNSTTRATTPGNYTDSINEEGSNSAVSESDDSASDDDNSDNDSTSSSEDESSELDEEDDSKLTAKELKAKYKDLNDFTIEDESKKADLEASSDYEMEDDDNSEPSGLAALYDNGNNNNITVDEEQDKELLAEKIKRFTDITEEEKMALRNQEGYNSLLDSDTSLSDSDDESMLDSEEEIEETEDESSNEEEMKDEVDTKKEPTLASLFDGGATLEDSDDDSVKSNDENIRQHETPISTPDEEEGGEAEGSSAKSGDTSTASPLISKVSDAVTNDQVNSVADVPIPSLLRGNLRIYQKQGLNWLASLYNNNTNGILADEMGLGKTIQTISLIAYLACEKHIWGPHLIIVPTSVMLNWEMEFKRFAPGFKVMTYYGNPQQRKEKRKGWNKPDSFHVCITSYQLVIQDHQAFRRKKWRYMILDEAHNIKNFRSQRWQALLNFNTENRLLLTGTPLQNNIMELWSLLYFLMPSSKASQSMPAGFANLQDFQQWFGRPVDKIIEAGGDTSADADDETKKTVAKLHQVLRPYLLRRLKADVEKQMPAKYEHIIYCRLSKRQRYLYDDFMSRAQTKETLASGNFLSIINCLMQLRKVCNHPDLFEVRPIVTSLAIRKSVVSDFDMKELVVRRNLRENDDTKVDLSVVNLIPTINESISTWNATSSSSLNANKYLKQDCAKLEDVLNKTEVQEDYTHLNSYYQFLKYKEQREALDHSEQLLYLNNLRCERNPIYGSNLINMLSITEINGPSNEKTSKAYQDIVKPLNTRISMMYNTIEKYAFVTPAVVALNMKNYVLPNESLRAEMMNTNSGIENPFHHSQVKLTIAFPDKSLLQYDCGKLQKLASLLLELKANGHRALIFTQMTKVLDILELFLNYHGYRYMRLDGATKIEDRQILTERFNTDPRITCFILSTRSGGLGINLTGADTVIFYDSDWNPAMDKQCQDRCHRIGQTRDVHIYRFVSQYTIESNILKKANQKRQLDNVVIQEGDFTTDYFGKLSVKDLIGEEVPIEGDNTIAKPLIPVADTDNKDFTSVLAQAEDEDDAAAANAAIKEVEVDDADFEESGMKSNGENTPGNDTSNSITRKPTTPLPGDNRKEQPENIKEEEYGEEMSDDDDVGHIDEYMIRFIDQGYYWE
ncbi:hypothetical protein PACTADRAFT_84091 [Pachysolen tannophilus NRRL Y-2460]|uniref:Helicase SWR1 n=1 Tax=Pachysolen tannophilus NRRL Y-2460 TaxID=669874 RepID=A0A1E4TYF0_PACTA|nr:hypothetical protein PACTADRAFT_84091 [Pachysolen tannophilus NRRL Y-2460]